MVPIKYIGTKARKLDTVAETGLSWRPGEVLRVPQWVALKLLKHPDVWAEATPEEVAAMTPVLEIHGEDDEPPKRDLDEDDPNALKVGLPSLSAFSKGALAQFALQRYGQVLGPALKASEMRQKIVNWENGGHTRGS